MPPSLRFPLLLCTLVAAALCASVSAQDVLTLGSGTCVNAYPGDIVRIPVYARDTGATPLGSDRSVADRIQALSFRILPSASGIIALDNHGNLAAEVKRAGVLANLTPLYEFAPHTSWMFGYAGVFDDPAQRIPLTVSASGSGDQVAEVVFAVSISAAAGTTLTLTIDPSPAVTALSNIGGTVAESVGAGLTVVSGCVYVQPSLPTPLNLIATAAQRSCSAGESAPCYKVDVAWSAVEGAAKYELLRKSGGTWTSLGVVTAASASDTDVVASRTYVYRVRARDSSNRPSLDSTPDAATTIDFTDPTLVAGSTSIKAVHITELRAAVNAFLACAGWSAGTYTDPALAPGLAAKALHISQLRQNLSAARSALGLPSVTYTDSQLSARSTTIKTVHIEELRAAVK